MKRESNSCVHCACRSGTKLSPEPLFCNRFSNVGVVHRLGVFFQNAEDCVTPREFRHSELCLPKKTGATCQSRSSKPDQGLNRTAPGRRPFRGVATGTASVEYRGPFGSRLVGLLKAVPDAHASARIVNGPGL